MSLPLDLDGLDGCLLPHLPAPPPPAPTAPSARAPRRLGPVAAGAALGLVVPATLFLVLHLPTEVVVAPTEVVVAAREATEVVVAAPEATEVVVAAPEVAVAPTEVVVAAPEATEVVVARAGAPTSGAPTTAPVAAPTDVVVVPAPPARPVPTSSWEVHFPSSGAEVTASAPSWLLDCPRVLVVGHTCSRGDPALNVRLALSRAEAMAARVVLAGVPAERIELRGAGDTEPVAPNQTLDGRRLNRRAVASCIPETAP